MSISKSKTLTQRLMCTALVALLTGCANIEKQVDADIAAVRKGPKEPPQRAITDFSDGLRCMDNLYLTFGIGNVSVLMEDLVDTTDAVKAGTRDMMISAVSGMTKRSEAVSIHAFGNDTGNLVSLLAQAEQKSVYETIPPFDIRGSITQHDKDLARGQRDIGGGVRGTTGNSLINVGAGSSKSASGSVLALDLSIVTTHNMSVMPGITSSNSVVITNAGKALDAQAQIGKAGVNFSVNSSKSEGMSQAVRALIELASIELFGKLFKVPYWKCLGLDESHKEIENEISDWFFTMNRNGTFTVYMKEQLYFRDFYEGEIDRKVDAAYLDAVEQYGQRIGIQTNGQPVDLDYFKAFLNSTPIDQLPSTLAYSKPRPKSKKEKKALEKNPPAVKQISVQVQSADKKGAYTPGEPIALQVTSNTDGFLYCFYKDSEDSIVRFFPNRFVTDNFVSTNGNILLPGAMPFEMTANANGLTESVHCYLTTRDVFADLPGTVRKQDFAVVDINEATQINDIFNSITRGRYGEGSFIIKTQ